MPQEHSRRTVLAALGSGTAAILGGCTGTSRDEPRTAVAQAQPVVEGGSGTETATDTPAWEIDPAETDMRIGAYYYSRWGPWTSDTGKWTGWSAFDPVLGAYNSMDPDVADQHIKWAREHGINWFNASWTGANTPDHHSPEEDALQNGFMEAELNDRIDFSLFYESGIPLPGEDGIDFDDPATVDRLHTDFAYMADEYFDEPNYLHIDGRPVVTFYSVHSFEGDVEGAFDEAVASLDTRPFLIADLWSGRDPMGVMNAADPDRMRVFDAATGFDLYDTETVQRTDGDYAAYVDWAERELTEWAIAADHADVHYIPDVLVGLDDTNIASRPEQHQHPVLHRDPDGFRDMLGVARDHMDPDLDTVMITSFNEWPEGSSVAPAESYGTTYLEGIRDELANGSAPDYVAPADHPLVGIMFDRTAAPPGGDAAFSFGMQLDGVTVHDADGSEVRQYDVGVPAEEPYFLEGAMDPERTDGETTYESFRWLGGPTGRSRFALHPAVADAASATIQGRAPPYVDEPITADVCVAGKKMSTVELTPDGGEFEVALRDGA